jgi:Beta-lactamase enzyme family
MRALVLAGVAAALWLPATGSASDIAFVNAVNSHLRTVRSLERTTLATHGDPDAVQSQYDAARDFVEALRAAGETSTACAHAALAAMRLAQGEVRQTEGYDLPDSAVIAAATRTISSATARFNAAADQCTHSTTRGGIAAAPVVLSSPVAGQAFFGAIPVRGAAPKGATAAVAAGDRKPPSCRAGRALAVGGRRVSGTVSLRQGRHALFVVFCSGPTPLRTTKVADVWVLGPAERRAAAPGADNASLTAGLGRLSRSFSGISGIWYHDLASGSRAQWNADAQFPAASTVKLGLLVAALRKFGLSSPVSYDIEAMATWSSNLATNRLLDKVGGSEAGGAAAAQSVLIRVGATRSTFTGGYRVGTGVRRSRLDPPRLSSRVTTARDLGRILFVLDSGALGNASALGLLGLSHPEAQLGLGLLLSSRPERDNVGLFRQALGKTTPAAQKQGWFSVVRHTAAIVYTPTGPRIVVLLTYAPDLSLVKAQEYGGRLIQLLRL